MPDKICTFNQNGLMLVTKRFLPQTLESQYSETPIRSHHCGRLACHRTTRHRGMFPISSLIVPAARAILATPRKHRYSWSSRLACRAHLQRKQPMTLTPRYSCSRVGLPVFHFRALSSLKARVPASWTFSKPGRPMSTTSATAWTPARASQPAIATRQFQHGRVPFFLRA